MSFFTRVAVVLLALFALVDPTIAQSRRPLREARPPVATQESQIRDRLNAGTIGLAAGLLEGAPIHFATEIARVVNEGGDMQVLPIVTRGPTENVNDLLYLRGVDIAIINSDSLEEYKSQVPQIQERIAYVLSLFPSELHIFVRPEIKTLADLAGKKVNFNTQGTAAAYSGPLIFSRLGIDVDKTFIPHPVALEKMRHGDEIAAVVFITSKPVDAFVKGKWEEGFKFLPVEYGPKFAGLLHFVLSRRCGLPQLHCQGPADRHHCGSYHPGFVQMAPGLAALSSGRAICRATVRPDRQAAISGIRPKMEGREPQYPSPRPGTSSGRAGMA